jgi:hypothetical protein
VVWLKGCARCHSRMRGCRARSGLLPVLSVARELRQRPRPFTEPVSRSAATKGQGGRSGRLEALLLFWGLTYMRFRRAYWVYIMSNLKNALHGRHQNNQERRGGEQKERRPGPFTAAITSTGWSTSKNWTILNKLLLAKARANRWRAERRLG